MEWGPREVSRPLSWISPSVTTSLLGRSSSVPDFCQGDLKGLLRLLLDAFESIVGGTRYRVRKDLGSLLRK
jgi:hypothetical protein